jgi:hypothetical protein
VDAETLQEIARQLAAEKAKQERLVARSTSTEAMSTETSASSKKLVSSSVESTSSSQPAKSSSTTELTSTSPMETDSASPARKHPRLEPEPEPMDQEMQCETSATGQVKAESNSMSEQSAKSESDGYLDELSNIPGVQVFRPGEPVRLSAEQQQVNHTSECQFNSISGHSIC